MGSRLFLSEITILNASLILGEHSSLSQCSLRLTHCVGISVDTTDIPYSPLPLQPRYIIIRYSWRLCISDWQTAFRYSHKNNPKTLMQLANDDYCQTKCPDDLHRGIVADTLGLSYISVLLCLFHHEHLIDAFVVTHR